MNNKRRSNPSKLQNYQASRGDRNHKNDYNYKDDRQDDLPRQRKLGYVEKLLNSFGFIQSIDDVSNSQGKSPGFPGLPDRIPAVKLKIPEGIFKIRNQNF